MWQAFFQYGKARQWVESAAGLVFVGTSLSVNITRHAVDVSHTHASCSWAGWLLAGLILDEALVLSHVLIGIVCCGCLLPLPVDASLLGVAACPCGTSTPRTR